MFQKRLLAALFVALLGLTQTAIAKTTTPLKSLAPAWVLKVSWKHPGADFYQECTIDKSGKVTVSNADLKTLRPSEANFDEAGITEMIQSVAQNSNIKSNANKPDNQRRNEYQRTEKDYFAKTADGKEILLRHIELEFSKQNIAKNSEDLIKAIDSRCKTEEAP